MSGDLLKLTLISLLKTRKIALKVTALRQSIEKMFNHIELMNRFAKAVFFNNNQKFQVATKEEQEKIIQCRLLLQNAIVLWNYMYLSEILIKVQSEE